MEAEKQVATIQYRLPMPTGLTDLDAGKWKVLIESIFPNAKTAEAVVMALDYCRARKLDIYKKPVNIVQMWNNTLKKNVETIWPSINEVQVTASRTGQYAGMDSPVWGEMQEKTFEGSIKGYDDDGVWQNNVATKLRVRFPESCAVTVYRLIGGQRCPFTEPVFWEERYGHVRKSEIPNSMWAKAPRGQLLKVAKAFSLRAAFPEEGEYTAEEMEGKDIAAGGVVIEHKDNAPTTGEATPRQVFGSAKEMKARWNVIRDALLICKTDDDLQKVFLDYGADFHSFKKVDPTLYENLVMIGQQRRDAINATEDFIRPDVDAAAEHVPPFIESEMAAERELNAARGIKY